MTKKEDCDECKNLPVGEVVAGHDHFKEYQLQNHLEFIREMSHIACQQGYLFSPTDVFAIGWLAARYNLMDLRNKKELECACSDYDIYDYLGLLDTIKETFMDLGYLEKEE